MFSKFFMRNNSRPAVKKASQLIDTKSHKQKKYISLMVVPSYSTGRTRTLRIPRAVLHGLVIGMLCISAVVTGFYLRSNYFMRMAQNLDMSLAETEETFREFKQDAEQVQDSLIAAATEIYSELTQIEDRAQNALNEQSRHYRSELEIINEMIEQTEAAVQEIADDLQAAMEGLSYRAQIIPPLGALVDELEASQAALRQYSRVHGYTDNDEETGVRLLSAGAGYVPLTYYNVQAHLLLLQEELAIHREMVDNFMAHRARMDLYLNNFPTLWPTRGQVSSEFGWRGNPFGGGGSEHHDGIDIRAPQGTSIYATGGGTVIFSGWQSGYGYTVRINHGNGIVTLYAHNTVNLVSVGQEVSRGDIIARVGSTGRSTGFHVHYEVIVNGTPICPRPFMHEHNNS